jgi:tetratricopeptide (TPR) repeat protein
MMKIRRKQKKELAAAIERGHRLIAGGGDRQAFEFLEQASQQFPEDPELRLLYATSLLAIRPKDAIPETVKAIELDPDEPVRLARAANLLFNMGQIETARSYAKRAKEKVTPDFWFYPELLNLDGHFAALDGDDELAEERLRAAMDREPEGGMFAVDLSKFLAKRGRHEEALEIVDQALTRSKRKESLEQLRGELLGEAKAD